MDEFEGTASPTTSTSNNSVEPAAPSTERSTSASFPQSPVLLPKWLRELAPKSQSTTTTPIPTATRTPPRRAFPPTTYGNAVTPDPVKVSARVSREVAGFGTVTRRHLHDALGLAWFVYLELLRRRDPKTGKVTITAKQLAQKLPNVARGRRSTPETMKKLLQKLEKLGLVETIKRPENPKMGPKRRQYFRDPITGRDRCKLVVDRLVFGAPGLGKSELFAVPCQTESLLAARGRHGGARDNAGGTRPGAGRPTTP